MNFGSLLSLLSVFSLLSVLALGGGTAVLPSMKHEAITLHQWMNADTFRDIYSIGQIAPGPNMLMVILIGYMVAGIPGGLVAFCAFFFPCCIIASARFSAHGHRPDDCWHHRDRQDGD